MQSSSDGDCLPTELHPAGVDRWSDIRSLHASSFRQLIAPSIEQAQVEAFLAWIYSPDYTDILQTHDVHAAWSDGRIIGTAGWVPADDSGASARVTAVFVSPLFQRLRVGRQLVAAAEARAAAAGFRSFTARAFVSSSGFYEALGYQRSSQGVQSLGAASGIPVIFLRKSPANLQRQTTKADPGTGHPVG